MTSHHPTSSALQRQLFAAVIVVAVLGRVASALWQGNVVSDLPGIYDQLSYHELAQRVAAGHGFTFAEGHWPATRAGEPTAHWSFLYTLYLAGVYALFGVQPWVARIIQAVMVGFLHPWLAWRVTRRIFGPTPALVAAALTAVYLYFVYYAGGLLTESFYFVGILWTIDASLRLATPENSKARWRTWLELGVAIGLTAMLRQVFLPFAPFLFAWLWWQVPDRADVSDQGAGRRPTSPSTLRGLALAACVVALLILPWSLRNYRAFGAFVPLNTNAGFAFYWGNHPIHGTTFIPLLGDTSPSYADLIPPELLSLNEGELDRALLREAVRTIAADPVRFIRLSVSRIGEYFKFWPSRDSSTLSNASRVLSFGLLMPFMLYGLASAIRILVHGRSRPQAARILLLITFVIVYAGIHLLSWTLVRYRLPVDVVLLVFAAQGLSEAWRRLATHVTEWSPKRRAVIGT